MSWTNCPNCGAVREPAEKRCPYCGTPYPKDRKVAEAVAMPEPVTIELDPGLVARLQILDEEMRRAIITPNEARRLLGMREV